jgi:hypothetical protein
MSKLDNANPEYLRIERGREALGRLAKNQTWEDWLAVGVAIDIGRAACHARERQEYAGGQGL